jgi:rhodanese-related sulfurtransferase
MTRTSVAARQGRQHGALDVTVGILGDTAQVDEAPPTLDPGHDSGITGAQGLGALLGQGDRPAVSAVDVALDEARSTLHRLTPAEAVAAQQGGALLVDTRTRSQRSRQGELPGAVVIDRTVLEWRLDPTSRWHIPEASAGRPVVLVCRQGYSSSLAAAALRRLGIDATDVVGGVEGWLAAGLPTSSGPADVRE